MAQQSLVGHGLLIVEASRSHSDTPHSVAQIISVGLLWSDSRELYLKTPDTHTKHTSMPPAVLEPAFPASERPQFHALDRVVTEISHKSFRC
jgi:hypothetical protein